ncbi:hypothetical protein CA7LBN_002843 [Candidozyma auris]|uniref:Peroxin/Ferlin domain-containing protein n=1 Tax=Candidozyma auris TaxID=498019 RepID=A0A8F2W1Q6_CANAR|nr:hypothetical protein CA7LBN_002843 [[Candida] auris]
MSTVPHSAHSVEYLTSPTAPKALMPQIEELADLLRANGYNPSGIDSALGGYEIPAEEGHEYAFQFIVENQRGMKFFGIPCFNKKSLIPVLDPPQYTRIDGSRVTLSDEHIENYPLPDLGWKWGWDSWYVLMLNDVDEQGWMYSSIVFRKRSHWHGKYYFGNFVRRRLWVRLRVRALPKESEDGEGVAEGPEELSSELQSVIPSDSMERQAELSSETPGKQRVPIKSVATCRETKTAVKFGFKYSKDVMKINKKKRDISCEKANGSDIRNIICILKSQCKHEATNISVDIATECREIIDRVKMKLNFQTLSRWVTDLVECLVLAYGFEFEPSEATEELIQIVLDSIHLLIGKNKTTRFTDQLLAIFIELASEAHPKEKAKVARSLIESTSPFELSRPFFKSQVLANCFCVCQGKILQQLLTLVHVYVTTYDSERIKCASMSVAAYQGIMCCTESATVQTVIKNLSAAGSKIEPSTDLRLYLLAMNPSTKSVTQEYTNNEIAGVDWPVAKK